MEAINKQEKQLKKKIKTQEIKKEEKLKKYMLLRDELDNILIHYDINLSVIGEKILKIFTDDERLIKYNNLFFKSGNPIVSNYDFFKKIWYIV